MPQLADPNFSRAVVLMIEHSEEGSFGLVINHPSPIKATELLESLEMSWRGEDFTTHNALIGNYAGADGIKTGYIDASGYNLVGTAARGKTRLIAIVMGGLTADRRDAETIGLLDETFDGLAEGTLRLPSMPASIPMAAPVRPHAMAAQPRAAVRTMDETAIMIAAGAILFEPGFGLLLVSAVASAA